MHFFLQKHHQGRENTKCSLSARTFAATPLSSLNSNNAFHLKKLSLLSSLPPFPSLAPDKPHGFGSVWLLLRLSLSAQLEAVS